MTSAQIMLARRVTLSLALIVLGIAPHACAPPAKPLAAPAVTVAPYDTAKGDLLWAVVPLRNESGTTEADNAAVSDRIVAAAEEVRGVRCLPLNRTLEAMRAAELTRIGSPADLKKLAELMGVDGLLVGSITAYDPYTPTSGLSLALYARDAVAPSKPLDPHALSSQPTEGALAGRSRFTERPAAVFSELLDGKNNQVLMDLRNYAAGRHDDYSALGWRRYAASMDLYTEFAASRAVAGLVQSEWIRLAGGAPSQGGEHR
jgi:hypothetical protein